MAEGSGIDTRLEFVGPLDPDVLAAYGRAADACVPLDDPAGPGSVRDLLRVMAAGAACIVPEHEALQDLPAGAVWRTASHRPPADELAHALGRLAEQPAAGSGLREAARRHVAAVHSPDAVAMRCAALIDLTARRRQAGHAVWRESAVEALAGCSSPLASAALLRRWAELHLRATGKVGAGSVPSEPWPNRLWVEATLLLEMQGNFTGITRTVVSLVQAFLRMPGLPLAFCRYHRGRQEFLEVGRDEVERRLEGDPFRPPEAADLSRPPIAVHPDDVLFLPELNIHYAGDIARLRATLGCPVAAMVYDLIPCKFPQWFVSTDVGPVFRQWVTAMLRSADLILAISAHTRGDLYEFAEENALIPPPVEVIRLGDSDLAERPAGRLDGAAGLTAGEPFVLIISTIKARKNHLLAYQAWRRLIERHGPAAVPKLVMVGGAGWLTGDLLTQVRHDPLTREHIRIVHGAGDAELAWLYRHCLFTLYPSHYEGWGLPLAEALTFGKLCLASRTSSMPEVGGDLVDYHDPADLSGYVTLLERAIFDEAYRTGRERQIRAHYRRTAWSECAEALLAQFARHFGPGTAFGPEDSAAAPRPAVPRLAPETFAA